MDRKYVDCGKAISRGRGDREDLRSSGGAAAAALSETVRAPPGRGACANTRAEPARRVATEVHRIRDRLVHPAAQDRRAHAARRPLSRGATAAAGLFLLPVDLRQQHRTVRDAVSYTHLTLPT